MQEFAVIMIKNISVAGNCMKHHLTIFIFCMLCLRGSNALFAQNTDEIEDFFYDSVQFEKPNVKFVTDLKSLNAKFIDTLKNPLAFIIETKPDKFSHKILLAVKGNNGFKVFELANHIDNIVKISRVNFNNKGSKELLLEYSNSSGTSGFSGGYHGWSDYERRFSIWDMDELTNLADFQNYLSHMEWWETFDPNEPDTLDNENEQLLIPDRNSLVRIIHLKLKEV